MIFENLIAKLNRPEYKHVNREALVTSILNSRSESEASKNLGLSKREFRAAMNMYNISKNIVNELYTVAAINDNIGYVNYFTKQVQNLNDIKGNIQKALDYAEGDDTVGGMVDQLRDLTLAGLSISASPDEIEDVNEFTDTFDVKGVIRDMLFKGIATDTMLLYGKTQGKKIVALSAIDPTAVKITPLNTFKDGIPQKQVEITEREKSGKIVTRTLAGSEFLESWSMKGTRDRQVSPSMARVFDSVELRRLIKDGDATIFLFIQRLIHQIKVGAKDTGSALSRVRGSASQLTPAKAKEIITKLETANKAMVEVTPPDWEHVFVHPPKELWESTKYDAPEMRIAQWSRIAPIIASGNGANYSGGYIYLKGLGGKISAYRERVAAMLQYVYRIYGGYETVKIGFNQLILKEHAQILKEVEFLKKHYGMSPRLAFSSLGYDWQIQENDMGTLFQEEDMQTLYTPFFEPNQGLLSEEAGRPSGDVDNDPNDVPRSE